MAMGATGVVVVVIAVILAVTLTGGTGSNKPATKASDAFALTPSVVAQVEAVPLSALVKQAQTEPSGTTPPTKLPAKNPALTSGGKPEFLFMGGEYCPYCAAERWAMVMALSKFGTFSNLKGTTSSATDVYPSTPTFSFYGSSFSSKYLTFDSVELYTNSGQNASTGAYPTLQTATAQENALMATYDAPPYVSSQSASGIPFLYIGGRFFEVGPQYVAANLTGMQFDTAAGLMSAGKNSTSKLAEASAGYLVGDICSVTHDQPAAVCSKVPSDLIGISTTSPKIKAVSVPAKGKKAGSTTTTATKPKTATSTANTPTTKASS